MEQACAALGVAPEHPPVEVVAGSEIVTASDVDEEVRAVVRRVLALAAEGTRLDRIAILYPPVEPYARTLDAQLSAAGVTYNGTSTRLLVDTVAGRTLDRVIRLVGATFARDELIDLFASVPLRTADGRSVPVDRWDRISRRAGVVDGDDWEVRLDRHARELEAQAADRAGAGLGGEDSVRREAQATRALAAFVADLARRLTDLERASGWAERVDRAKAAMVDLLGEEARHGWPDDERDAWDTSLAVLDACAALDAVEPDPSFATFAAAVGVELRAPVGRRGTFGDGVLCASIGSGLGLDLDAVFAIGLAEGQYPIARREDALLADADRQLAPPGALATRESALADQTRALLAALAAGAEHRVLSFARGDLRTARERLPSRLLLDTASALAGVRVFASDFVALGPSHSVDAVPSFSAGLARRDESPSLVERELGDLAAFVAAGGDVLAHPATRADRPEGAVVGIGVEATRARASSALTRWDGNVSLVADRVRSPATGDIVSATRLEAWSSCPFRYFLANVLRIPVEDTPERLLELTPLDRGSLVHEVLERFIAEELDRPVADRVPAGAPWPLTAGRGDA